MTKHSFIKTFFYFSAFVAIAYAINGCTDPSVLPIQTNDKELITTLKIELTDTITGNKLNYFFRDLDGIGGKSPSQWDTISLNDSSYYRVNLKLLDESNANAVDDVSQEIFAERATHIICYAIQNVNTVINRTDTDGTYQLGLASTWKTGSSSAGDVVITLKHQPGSKNGGCTAGETDVEVKFRMLVK